MNKKMLIIIALGTVMTSPNGYAALDATKLPNLAVKILSLDPKFDLAKEAVKPLQVGDKSYARLTVYAGCGNPDKKLNPTQVGLCTQLKCDVSSPVGRLKCARVGVQDMITAYAPLNDLLSTNGIIMTIADMSGIQDIKKNFAPLAKYIQQIEDILEKVLKALPE